MKGCKKAHIIGTVKVAASSIGKLTKNQLKDMMAR